MSGSEQLNRAGDVLSALDEGFLDISSAGRTRSREESKTSPGKQM